MHTLVCRRLQLAKLADAVAGHADGLQAQDLLRGEVAERRHGLLAAVLADVLLQPRLQRRRKTSLLLCRSLPAVSVAVHNMYPVTSLPMLTRAIYC